MAMIAWDVFLRDDRAVADRANDWTNHYWKWIDTVFDSEKDADEVKRSLINHDGYDPRIVVRRAAKGR